MVNPKKTNKKKMKTKLFYTAAIAITLFFAACSGGVSDATKKSVAAFDSSMSLMQTQVMAFSDSVKAAMSMCEKGCTMPDSCKGMCADMQAKCDSAMAPCKADMKNFEDIAAAMMAAKPHIDSVSADFAAFKEKVNKGEIKDAEATKTLADFTTKMADGGKMFADWNTKLAEAKGTCMKNMMDCMEKCKSMGKCDGKDCKDKDKKKKKA